MHARPLPRSKNRIKDDKAESRKYAAGEERCGVRLEVSTHSLLITRPTFQIAIKSIRNVEDALDVRHAEGFFVVYCEGLGGSDGVLDLCLRLESVSTQRTEVGWELGGEGKSIPVDRSNYAY
jgi:hypothetical protein